MSALGLPLREERTGFLIGSGVLVVIGVVVLALLPAKPVPEVAAHVRAEALTR